jgi:excisionase family DNA binding protein
MTVPPSDPDSHIAVGSGTYLTTADALAYLKTAPRTLYRWLASGEIPAVRMGHQWRFRKGDLDRWVEERARNHSPASRKLHAKNVESGAA